MRYKIYQILTLLFLFFFFANTRAQQMPPVDYPGEAIPLHEYECLELKNALEEELFENTYWKKLLKTKKMAVGIVDLSDLNNIKYAGLNDTHMMYAASLPKIAVLYAVMYGIKKGEIIETEAIRRDLRLMISKSNNAAATRMIDLVGFKKIEAVLRLSDSKFYDESRGGGLWVGKRYARSGKRVGDPLKGLSHGATVSVVCNYYYYLALGKLIDKQRSTEMLEFLKDPALHHKFVNTLKRIAPDATIYRKSGSWKQFHSDSALVWGTKRKYIIVALIENSNGESIIRNLVIPMENVLEKVSKMNCGN